MVKPAERKMAEQLVASLSVCSSRGYHETIAGPDGVIEAKVAGRARAGAKVEPTRIGDTVAASKRAWPVREGAARGCHSKAKAGREAAAKPAKAAAKPAGPAPSPPSS